MIVPAFACWATAGEGGGFKPIFALRPDDSGLLFCLFIACLAETASKLFINKNAANAAALFGGEGGIRTRDTLSSIHTFQACSFNHSDTSPKKAHKEMENSRKDSFHSDFSELCGL